MNPVVLQLELYIADWEQFIYETGIYVSCITYMQGKQFFDEYTYTMLTDKPVWIY